MYTQCPECNKQQSISVEQLRDSQGQISCQECSATFNALKLLAKGALPATEENYEEALFKQGSSIKALNSTWTLGLCFSLCLLIFQIYFFESYTMTQNTSLRPWLNKACYYLDCKLPIYKNLDELSILHGSFEPMENQNYIFKTAFTNQASFAQAHPAIKLTLIDYNGQSFAERIFLPKEYLKHTISAINPDMSSEVTMHISAPSNTIGGYRFELI